MAPLLLPPPRGWLCASVSGSPNTQRPQSHCRPGQAHSQDPGARAGASKSHNPAIGPHAKRRNTVKSEITTVILSFLRILLSVLGAKEQHIKTVCMYRWQNMPLFGNSSCKYLQTGLFYTKGYLGRKNQVLRGCFKGGSRQTQQPTRLGPLLAPGSLHVPDQGG